MSLLSAIDSIFRSLTARSTSTPSAHDPTLPYSSSARSQPIPTPTILGSLNPAASSAVGSLLVTLHFLFPHELLPALDLLDRKLLTFLQFSESSNGGSSRTAVTGAVSEPASLENSTKAEVWYVQSASAVTESSYSRPTLASGQGRDRFRNAMRATSTHYEVRLDTWNCSCAAFAFSCFQLLTVMEDERERDELDDEEAREEGEDGEEGWTFGGMATRRGDRMGVPVCKHILAAAVAKAAPELSRGAVARREGEREEVAGRGAGWGDHG